MKRLAVLYYSLTGYMLGVAALGYLIGFLFNLFVPKSIDSGQPGNALIAVAVDLGLIALFGLQHSVMARPKFKAWLTRYIPSAAERSTYMLATALTVFALCLFWQPLPGVVWQAESRLLYNALLGVGLAGWGLVLFATFMINHFDLFGLRQAWLYFCGRPYTQLPFRTVALYRYIRHPIMTGAFIGIWFAPVLTAGHVLFATAMSLYILIGVWHEEKDLVSAFGERYQRYRHVTGRFLPVLVGKGRTADGQRPVGYRDAA